MKALIIIVNWRNAALTLRAAESIRSQLRNGDRLVLVDNGSEDDSVHTLRAAGFEVVETGHNLGFGGGVNVGARGMCEDALVLLNNDAVAQEGFLEAILAPFSSETGSRIGATTGRILLSGRWTRAQESHLGVLTNRDGERWQRTQAGGIELVNSTGNLVDASGNGYDRDFLKPADEVHADPEVFGLCGGACAIRRAAWEQVGTFREDLFMYYEDTELSWRLRESGWTIRYESSATTVHEHAASSGTTSPIFLKYNTRNRIVVAVLHGSTSMGWRAGSRTFLRALRGPEHRIVACALAQSLASMPHLLAERRRMRRRTCPVG